MDKSELESGALLDKGSEEATQERENNGTPWQRISPIALVYFLLMFFKNIFSNIVYLAPAIILGYDKVTEAPQLWLPIIFGVLGLATLFSILSFYFFQYRLSNQQIEIRSGVFSKTNINLPFARIQNVELNAPWYYRPFGYTSMQLDTAGSTQKEAKVVAIKETLALSLKKQIIASAKQARQVNELNAAHPNENGLNEERLKEQSGNEEPWVEIEEQEEVQLDSRNLDDLVIHGLTNNRIWIFLGTMAPFIDNASEGIGNFLRRFGIHIEDYLLFDGMSMWQMTWHVISIALFFLIPITLFSIIGAILTFHDFTLHRSGDRYIRRSGFFTRNEITMRLSRLQMIVQQQDWLDKFLGRRNLKFEQSNANITQSQSGQQSNKILVPSVTKKECEALMQDAYPDNQLDSIAFNKVSWRLLLRNLLLFVTPILTALYFVFVSNDYEDSIQVYVLIAFIIISLSCLRYWRWGYAIDENYVYIRKGCIGVNYYCFPLHKVQQTVFKQSWFLKRNKLCAVQFVLASGMVSVPYLSQTDGVKLIDLCLREVEESKRNWM